MNCLSRNVQVDLLRGIAAICMILGHSFIVHPIDISNIPWCFAVERIIYTFHMELFFILSGWVYHCASYGSYIQKKCRRLLTPYCIFGTVSLLLHAFGGSAVNGSVPLLDGLLKMLLRGGSYWFIYTLFVIFLVYPLLDHCCRDRRAKWIALVCCLVLNEFMDLPDILCLNAAVSYLPYFILGDILGKQNLSRFDYAPKRRILAGSALCVLVFLVSDRMLSRNLFPVLGESLTFLRAVAFSALLYLLCTLWNRPETAPLGFLRNILSDASRYSLQLYLFNGYLMTALRILVCSLLGIRTPLFIVLSIWLGNIVITFFVCKVILPRSRFLRTLCGL